MCERETHTHTHRHREREREWWEKEIIMYSELQLLSSASLLCPLKGMTLLFRMTNCLHILHGAFHRVNGLCRVLDIIIWDQLHENLLHGGCQQNNRS